jgi:hypothetical protein
MVVKLKKEGQILSKINTADRSNLKERLKRIWSFYREHDISTGIDRETWDLFNQLETEVYRKDPIVYPNQSKILPYIVFNDRDLTMGGRMYGAFWIGEQKILRRTVTIDGKKTSDVDGRAMHVQLLYKGIGQPLPVGDPYLFTNERRSITKNLMLLMMNTKKEMEPLGGRKAVVRTYRNRFGVPEGHEDLEDLILKLETHHHLITDLFYKPNWGHLQRTEAAIILGIMERGMNDDIVILPVHDGCLCTRDNTEQVLKYFSDAGIEAMENRKHLQPLPVEETIEVLRAHRKRSLCV